jgi:multiple sugar transport system permease protein
VVPLCKPALAALATLEFTWYWNNYIWVVSLIESSNNFTAIGGLLSFRGEFVNDWTLISAAALLVAAPVMVVYFLLQRYFVGGLFTGSNK